MRNQILKSSRGNRLLRKQGLAAFVACSLVTVPGSVRGATFDVDVSSPQFTLYADPYNGNQIQIGGFSGVYPVAGKRDCFYVVTDRGPAPDFVDANGTLFKAFATPGFGPHILTVRLQANGGAKIDDVKPLKRPGGGYISGLPTTVPATD